jgi:undecaprenyl-diphosphatase
MRPILIAVFLSQVLSFSTSAGAQRDSVASSTARVSLLHAWIVPLSIAASAAADPELREWILARHSRSLDHLAKAVNPLGTAHLLVPAMVLTYAGGFLAHNESLQAGTINTAAAYVTVDVVESLLKPVVGRQRPHVAGNSHRFHAFTTNGDWHSFPSAHVAHITAIATAVAVQAQSSRVSAVCAGVTAIVALDRVYEDQHWASDVVATAALSSMVSGATLRWLDSRFHHRPQ